MSKISYFIHSSKNDSVPRILDSNIHNVDTSYITGADPGFYVRGGALLGEGSEDRLGLQRAQSSARWGEVPLKLQRIRKYRTSFLNRN
jgi:hypothetical protein